MGLTQLEARRGSAGTRLGPGVIAVLGLVLACGPPDVEITAAGEVAGQSFELIDGVFAEQHHTEQDWEGTYVSDHILIELESIDEVCIRANGGETDEDDRWSVSIYFEAPSSGDSPQSHAGTMYDGAIADEYHGSCDFAEDAGFSALVSHVSPAGWEEWVSVGGTLEIQEHRPEVQGWLQGTAEFEVARCDGTIVPAEEEIEGSLEVSFLVTYCRLPYF